MSQMELGLWFIRGREPMRWRVKLAFGKGASRVVSRGILSLKPPKLVHGFCTSRRLSFHVILRSFSFVRRVLLPVAVSGRFDVHIAAGFPAVFGFDVLVLVPWFTKHALRYDRTPATDRLIEQYRPPFHHAT